MKKWVVFYRSRYFPLEGEKRITVISPSKMDIRARWHDLMETDEYKIVRIEEVKS